MQASNAETIIAGDLPETHAARRLSVLISSTYYWPEASGNAPYVTGLAEYLSARGHEVVVSTSFPHYPEWRSSANVGRARESRAGVEVRRRRHYVPPVQSAARRALYETALFATGARAMRERRHAFDVVVGVSPTLAAASLALVAARTYGAPAGIVFQDLMGRAAVESGVKGGGPVAGVVGQVELRLARQATALAVVSPGFQSYFEARGIEPDKIFRIHNWDLGVAPSASREETRARFGWSDAEFVCLYAGSMGHKQGLDNALQAATRLPPGVRVVLAGDGSDRPRLEGLAHELRLGNVEFLGVQPPGAYEALLRAADVLLVNQRPSVRDMSLASKLASYFAAGRPVIGAVASTSETGRALIESRGGLLVPPAAPGELAAAIQSLCTDPAKAAELARHGRRYALEHLSADSALAKYERFIESLAERNPKRNEAR